MKAKNALALLLAARRHNLVYLDMRYQPKFLFPFGMFCFSLPHDPAFLSLFIGLADDIERGAARKLFNRVTFLKNFERGNKVIWWVETEPSFIARRREQLITLEEWIRFAEGQMATF